MDLKGITDEAVNGLDVVEKVVVWHREATDGSKSNDKEVDFNRASGLRKPPMRPGRDGL